MHNLFLADLSSAAQTPHPVFGIPVGLGLLILLLFKLCKSNDSSDNSSGSEYKPPPPINTAKFGKHKFNKNGFCLKCGWEREFLVKTNRLECEEKED